MAHWINLFNAFGAEAFKNVFKQVANLKKLADIKEMCLILTALKALNNENFNAFIVEQLAFIMTHLLDFQLDRNAFNKNYNNDVSIILKHILALSTLRNSDAEWIQSSVRLLTKTLTPKYVNEVLIPAVLGSEGHQHLNLIQQIAAICKFDLGKRVAAKPLMPENWTMAVPQTSSNQEIWKILTPFLNSPTQTVFNYQKSLSEKKFMEAFIRNTDADLKTDMDKNTKPHTLQVIKTRTSHNKALALWKADEDLLNQLNSFI